MAKQTKASLIETRRTTLRLVDVECCKTCKHGWFVFSNQSGNCMAIQVRNKTIREAITQFHVCDLFERKVIKAEKKKCIKCGNGDSAISLNGMCDACDMGRWYDAAKGMRDERKAK